VHQFSKIRLNFHTFYSISEMKLVTPKYFFHFWNKQFIICGTFCAYILKLECWQKLCHGTVQAELKKMFKTWLGIFVILVWPIQYHTIVLLAVYQYCCTLQLTLAVILHIDVSQLYVLHSTACEMLKWDKFYGNTLKLYITPKCSSVINNSLTAFF